jgi:hypothetical protein
METRKTLLVLSLLTFVSMGVFAQESTRQWSENGRFGIGVGYNFRNVPRSAKAMRPMEFSLKYSINNKHSIYANIPLYIKDKHDMLYNAIKEEWVKSEIPQRLYGGGLGYNYNIIRKNNFSEFIGLGFDYFHSKEQKKWWEGESTDSQNIYAISPQFGAEYRFDHFKVELKYEYHLSRVREKIIFDSVENERNNSSEIHHSYKTLKSLNLSVYYYF